ncbi:MAG: c-type cytochrome domain-containing protein, partial [Verrucomicrobiota bacterium]
MKPTLPLTALLLAPLAALHAADKTPQPIATLIERNCTECHDAETKKGKLDLTALSFDLDDPKGMDRWVHVFDRVENGEMPPKPEDMKPEDRKALLAALESSLHAASAKATAQKGRGTMRRLNRIEFEQNLRDLLA